MIHLLESHYLNEGAFQKCYFHPKKENLCIKVKKDILHKDPRVDREIKYYEKIQKKKDTSINFFAKYHGITNTNLGPGYIFDLIRDEKTNSVSLTMYDYLKMQDSPISDETFLKQLKKMKEEMIKHKIIARDIKAKNLCCRILENNSMELILIDGISHRDFIPAVDWITFFSTRKTNRIFEKKKLNSISEQRNHLESLNP